jgi:hypothetical protein
MTYSGQIFRVSKPRAPINLEGLRENSGLLAAIDAGDIVVNDGTNDLPAEEGKAHLFAPLFGEVEHPFYVTIDRQKRDTSIPFVTTSRTLVNLNGMTLTTKDLDGLGSYVITFSCIYKHEGEDKNCRFSMNVDGVEVAFGVAVGFKNGKRGSFSITHKENAVAAGTVIKIQVSQASIDTAVDELTITGRHLVVDGVKGALVL